MPRISFQRSEEGFTLIELLVVILIIGILAAIAIPSFLNQRQKGQDACAKSAARSMQIAMETYRIDNNSYAADLAALAAIDPALADPAPCGDTGGVGGGGGSFIATALPAILAYAEVEDPGETELPNVVAGTYDDCTAGTGGSNNYCVAVGASSGHYFAILHDSAGGTVRACLPAGEGGCPDSGLW